MPHDTSRSPSARAAVARAALARAALAVLALGTALVGPTARADEAPTLIRFGVTKDGLKFTGPCSVTAFSVDKGADPQAPVAEGEDAAEGLPLADGSYQAVIGCPSTEGTLRQTVPFRVRGKDELVPVTMVPAFVVADVQRSGVEVPADISIYDANGRLMAEGKARVALPVPAGTLTVRAVVDKKAAGRRKPVRGEAVVRTKAGQKETPLIDTSDGKILLTLTANGRTVEGVGALRHRGQLERLVEINAGEETEVPPGTYDLVTALFESHDFQEEVTRDVSVAPGKTTKLKVNHTVGMLTPDVRLGGKPLPEGQKAEVDLFLGEALKPFNTIQATETATLRPGTFRVVARMQGKKLDDRSPWEAEARATVKAGRATPVRVDLAAAGLDVKTTLGKVPTDTRVEILREDGTAPVAKREAKGDEAAHFDLPAGAWRVRSVVKTPTGEHAFEKKVELRWGKTTAVELDHVLGRVVVQVFDKGVAVPAKVSFISDGAAGAAAEAKAGQEVLLPPDSYTLIVERRGKRQTFSALKVAAGRLVERQVELSEQKPEEKKPDRSAEGEELDESDLAEGELDLP